MERSNRIEILDGLRVLAILMVMIFHYYARYQGVYYSYNFKVPTIFNHGRFGVQLFFIISGFVITLTLSKSRTFLEFMKKRFIRLLPGMVICATLTFLIFFLFDKNNLMPRCKNPFNLLLSYTFLSPKLINTVFGTDLQYIDGSYWSIWTELQFYVIGGITYFLSPRNFMRNYLIIVAITFPVCYLFTSAHFTSTAEHFFGHNSAIRGRELFDILNLFQHNGWFLAGIVLNKMYFSKKKDPRLMYLFGGILLFEMIIYMNIYITAICLVFFILFFLFLNKPHYLSFLSSKSLSKVGVASYSIYLIHENVGFLIMNRIGNSLQNWNWIIPIFLIVLSTLFGLFSYKYMEEPFIGTLKQMLFKTKQGRILDKPIVSTLP